MKCLSIEVYREGVVYRVSFTEIVSFVKRCTERVWFIECCL